jgi:hypothetical protein
MRAPSLLTAALLAALVAQRKSIVRKSGWAAADDSAGAFHIDDAAQGLNPNCLPKPHPLAKARAI